MGVTAGRGVAAEIAEAPKIEASEGGVAAALGLEAAAEPGKRVPETPRALHSDCASNAAFSRVSVLALSDGSSRTGAFSHVAARRLSPAGRGLLLGKFGRFPRLSPSCGRGAFQR